MSGPEPLSAQETIAALVRRLSYEDKERILCNLLWEVFGDIDDHENPCLIPDRTLDRADIDGLVAGLRQEFFPERED